MKVKVSDILDNVPIEITNWLTDQLLELLEWQFASKNNMKLRISTGLEQSQDHQSTKKYIPGLRRNIWRFLLTQMESENLLKHEISAKLKLTKTSL